MRRADKPEYQSCRGVQKMWSKEFSKVGLIGALTLYVCKRVATIAEAEQKFFGIVDARQDAVVGPIFAGACKAILFALLKLFGLAW